MYTLLRFDSEKAASGHNKYLQKLFSSCSSLQVAENNGEGKWNVFRSKVSEQIASNVGDHP